MRKHNKRIANRWRRDGKDSRAELHAVLSDPKYQYHANYTLICLLSRVVPNP